MFPFMMQVIPASIPPRLLRLEMLAFGIDGVVVMFEVWLEDEQ